MARFVASALILTAHRDLKSFKIDDEDEDAYPFECIQQGIQSCKKNWMNKRVFKPSRN